MRTILAFATLLSVALLAWLWWPAGDAATAVTPAAPPPAIAAAHEKASAPTATEASAPEVVAERTPALPADGAPANVRVVVFGSDRGVADAVVRFLRPDFDWAKLTDAERQEFQRLQDLEAFQLRYGDQCRTDAAGGCHVPTGQHGTQVTARSGDLYAEGHARSDTKEPTVLALRPDRTLHVLVVDASGRPVPGIGVLAKRVSDAAFVDPRQTSAWQLGETDAAGRFRRVHFQTMVGDEPQLLFDLLAQLPGGEGPAVRIEATAPPEEVVLHLPPAGAVVVHLRNARGQPLDVRYLGEPEVSLHLLTGQPGSRRESDDAMNQGRQFRARLDANADARFPCVMFDRWLLVQQGYGIGRAECAGPTLDQPLVEVTMQEGADEVIVTGVLLQPDRTPFASRNVTVKCQSEGSFGSRMLRTDEGGRVRSSLGDSFKGREATVGFTTDAQMQQDGLAIELPPRRLQAGINDLGEVALAPFGVLVAGRLRCDDGVEAKQVQLEFERMHGNRWQKEYNLRPFWQPDGSFSVRSGIKAGELLRLLVREGPYLPLEPIECRTGDTGVEIHLRAAGSVTATLLVDDSTPLDRLSMRLLRTEPPERPDPRQEMMRRFGDHHFIQAKDGRATRTWTGLVPGSYRLTVECQGSGEPFVILDALRVGGGQCTDPRLAAIDLRGRLRVLDVRATGPDGADITSRDAFVLIQGKGDTWHGYNLLRGVARIATATSVDLLVVARDYEMARAAGVTASCSIPLQPAKPTRLQVLLPSPLPDGVQLRLLLRPELGFNRRISVMLDTGRGMGIENFFTEEGALAADGSVDVLVRWPGEHAVEGRLSRGDRGGWALRAFDPDTVTLPAAGVSLHVGAKGLGEVLSRLPK